MPSEKPSNTAVLRYLSGPQRGLVETLARKTLFVVADVMGNARIVTPDGHPNESCMGILHRMGSSYELEVSENYDVWINGNLVDEKHALKSGDLLELGRSGPVLRYRLYPPGTVPEKNLAEALADSIEVSKVDSASRLGRTGKFLTALAQDLATKTTLWFRVWTLVLLTLLVFAIVALVFQNYLFQKQLSTDSFRIESISKILEQTSAKAITSYELDQLREEVSKGLVAALERLTLLEERSDVYARIISEAMESIVFVQGSYGFIDSNSDRPLRSIKIPNDRYLFTFDESGEFVTIPFSGTAFIATVDGLLVTNRHIAEPWRISEPFPSPDQINLVPVIQRIRAFIPGSETFVSIKPVHISEQVDLAVMQSDNGARGVKMLELEMQVPEPGDEVLVLGYPLGLSGIIGRTSLEYLSDTNETNLDYWEMGDKLAHEGHIKPLVSKGIVSQVTEKFIVYDAETTLGGSGGPVLDLHGKVVAVNTAVMRGFGGSNLGIPAAHVAELLARISSQPD